MLMILILGVFVISGMGVVLFAAYKIKAKSFTFKAAIWKIAEFSIIIEKPEEKEEGRKPRGNLS